MPLENDGTLITLLDENGKEQEFEHLATLEHNGSTYVALVPSFDDPEEAVNSAGELVILKVITENNEEMLASIEDDAEFDEVSGEFEKLLDEDYDIVEEEEEKEEEEEN